MFTSNAPQYYVVGTLPILFTVNTSIRAYHFIQHFLYSNRNETQIKNKCCPVSFLVWFI